MHIFREYIKRLNVMRILLLFLNFPCVGISQNTSKYMFSVKCKLLLHNPGKCLCRFNVTVCFLSWTLVALDLTGEPFHATSPPLHHVLEETFFGGHMFLYARQLVDITPFQTRHFRELWRRDVAEHCHDNQRNDNKLKQSERCTIT